MILLRQCTLPPITLPNVQTNVLSPYIGQFSLKFLLFEAKLSLTYLYVTLVSYCCYHHYQDIMT